MLLDCYTINFYFKSVFYEKRIISTDVRSELLNEKLIPKFGTYTFFEICYINLRTNEIRLGKLLQGEVPFFTCGPVIDLNGR
ncbi:hypothetical protein RU08_23040 [Pseudomonas fulva]|uniref:Uncharacterized protein n=1 Tax=Pseudomonas fulva TaxID=47880 RepID=A0A0D0JZV5_9PSED|nr:hypothetical protein RU08_23040 [Pseudomonas fulva]